MFTRLSAGVFVALLGSTLWAADREAPPSGQGYIYYGAGRHFGCCSAQQLGGGGDIFIYKGLAASPDIGYFFPSEGFTYGIGMLSVNGSYHLNRSRHKKWSPFVTTGYTLAFREGHANLYNFGAGITWWPAQHVGVRVEFRDYVWPGTSNGHAPQVRFAISFR